MNIDEALANRALAAIGQDPLTYSDYAGETLRFRVVKDFYLATFIEAFSEVAWTGRKARAFLAPARTEGNTSAYRFMYDLPLDCAKPLELQDKAYYAVEGGYLYTDRYKAELVYISDGRTMPPATNITCGGSRLRGAKLFIHGGTSYTRPAVRISCGDSRQFDDTNTDYAAWAEEVAERLAEQYPGYDPIPAEPKFTEYVEKALAAKLAVELADSPRMRERLMDEAAAVKNEAVAASRSAAAGTRNGQMLWKDRLGLGSF
jgi:hypothetical protein